MRRAKLPGLLRVRWMSHISLCAPWHGLFRRQPPQAGSFQHSVTSQELWRTPSGSPAPAGMHIGCIMPCFEPIGHACIACNSSQLYLQSLQRGARLMPPSIAHCASKPYIGAICPLWSSCLMCRHLVVGLASQSYKCSLAVPE
jgi:hypothetical protein